MKVILRRLHDWLAEGIKSITDLKNLPYLDCGIQLFDL